MTTTTGRIGRVLIAALLLLAAPAPGIAQSTSPSLDAAVATARSLLRDGRPDEALAVLRPLAESHPELTNIRFMLGLSAVEASQMAGLDEGAREALLDEAVAVLHAMLVDQPGLVRVRLELARAFFFRGDDNLSRDHFERVLAGTPPAAVAANVQRFLSLIRARRRWTMYLGMALLPDSNIGGASDEETIYLPLFGTVLPFQRDNADELVSSGIGASVWTGGEYQYPLRNRLRLRAGADLSRREYAGRQFDDMHLSLHAGPRWLIGPRAEMSVLASARRRWLGTGIEHDALGARIEARRRLAPRVSAYARASWHNRDYRNAKFRNGPAVDVSLGGTWTVSPIMQANGAVGYGEERPELERFRNDSRWLRAGLSVSLPRGFTVGGSAQFRWTGYEGIQSPPTIDNAPREDRTRTLSLSLFKRDFTVYGFSPQIVVTHEERDTNAQALDYNRTRGELRLVRQF